MYRSKTPILKYKKRAGIYTNSTGSLTFNPMTLDAHSYRWWRFVAKVEGKVIFNNYRYSASTTQHQWKMRRLLDELGIKVDLYLGLPKGIKAGVSLEDMIIEAEEALCDAWVRERLKGQDAYQRVKARRAESDKQTNGVPF